MVCETISKVERNHQWYRSVCDGDEGPLAEVQANVVDDLDDISAQEALWNGDGESSFTTGDCCVNFTSLSRLSKTFLTLGSVVVDFKRLLVDNEEAFYADIENTKKKVEQQTELISIVEKSTNNTLRDVASFCGRLAAIDTCEAVLLSCTSAALNRLTRATDEFR